MANRRPADIESPKITDRSITRLYGEKLADGRKQTGMTQTAAAAAIGVDQKTISRWEKGEKQPTLQMLRAVAAAYGCKISTLMPRNQYPSAPLDPEARQEWVWRRNALISKVPDVDEYMQTMRDQRARAHGRPSNLAAR